MPGIVQFWLERASCCVAGSSVHPSGTPEGTERGEREELAEDPEGRGNIVSGKKLTPPGLLGLPKAIGSMVVDELQSVEWRVS